MNQGQYVFSQLVSHLDRNHFNYLARKYGGNKYVKHFSCWNQLLAMMFGQLSNRESLRDVVVALEAYHSKCKFLGIGSKPIAKTTLASANQNRDYRIFEDFAFYTVTTASKHDSVEMSTIPYEPNAYYIFDRAYVSFKELYRIRLTDSFYVVIAKTNLKYKIVKWKRRMPKNVLTDAEVKLTGYLSEKKYPESFRLVRYYDEEEEREFTFLTDAKHLNALEVAELYKKRWLVELFD